MRITTESILHTLEVNKDLKEFVNYVSSPSVIFDIKYMNNDINMMCSKLLEYDNDNNKINLLSKTINFDELHKNNKMLSILLYKIITNKNALD